jgi:hypothetical protein
MEHVWVRSGHGEGRRACGGGLRQALEEGVCKKVSSRQGKEMEAEKVTRGLD